MGETRNFYVPNGSHSVMIRRISKYISGSRRGRTFGEENFSAGIIQLNNEQYEIRIGYSGIRSTNKKPLVDPTTSQNAIAMRDNAIEKSFNTMQALIPNGSKIAIINISPDNDEGIFIREELMVHFVNARKYIIVDRQTLETIRHEQRFQMTGEVSDESALSIGHFLGADVVITGNISGAGNQKRLRIRALDVKTAQILAMSSENL